MFVLIVACLHYVAVGLYIIHTYVRIYIHRYIHTYTHTYVHTYIHTYIHTYVHTYVRAYIRTYIHTYVHTYIHTYTHTYISNNSYISCSNDEPGVEHPRGFKIYTFLLLTDTLVTAIEVTREYFSGVINGIQILISSLLKCVCTNLFINLKFIFL